jgi:hypothetical protein
MSHRRFAGWSALVSCAAIVLITPVSGAERTTVVTTTAELLAALAAGDRTILMRPGTYELNQAIQVPDNTTLIGEGTMVYDNAGLPTGFIQESRTVIAAVPGVTGDFVTLGNGASLHGLVIQDVARPADTGGVVVMVASRGPSASVWAQIVECEIINPNPGGANNAGATGRGLLAYTRNGPTSGGGVSHEQSVVSVRLTRSIIRSLVPAGADSIFALNNASRSHIYLHLHQNVMGRLTANGGVSRPDSTVDARLFILSSGNLYRADSVTALTGWTLNGGTDAPMLAPLVAGETLNNKIWMYSFGDRIEGFGRAITATAGLRMSVAAGAISGNEIELTLLGTRLVSTAVFDPITNSTAVADVRLFGARTGPAGDVATGDGNVLRVTMRNVIGSAPAGLLRAPVNDYGDAFTSIGTNLGTGNRLMITGSPNDFSRTNQGIRPMPSVRFFTNSR